MNSFDPPPFVPHPFFRGGHLQTIVPIRRGSDDHLPTVRHEVAVSDGDTITLHDDRPAEWVSGAPAMLLIHGLAGCHAAPYMIRLAQRFYRSRVTRVSDGYARLWRRHRDRESIDSRRAK